MWGRVRWCRDCAREHGGIIGRRALLALEMTEQREGFTPDVLQRLADGAIMDPCRLFLPAGKLTEAEARAREARILRGAGA